MSSGNEMNNETGETDFGRIAVKSNNSTEDISINQPNNSNVTTNIGFNQNNSNGGGSPKSIYSSQPNISNGTRNIRIDQLTDSSNIGNGGDIDFNNSNNRNGSIEDGDPNQLKNDNNNNNNNNTKEEEALERFNQEPSVRFLKIIEEQRADFEKSIKEDILKIEQLKLGIIEKQKKIDTLNAIIKEGKQKKSSAGKSKMLPSFSNQTVSKRPTIERKILIMEDYKKRTSTVKELCERYKITRTTFYRIKKNYMEFKGGLNEDKVDLRGRNSKLNKDCIGALYYEITTQPKGTTTVRDLTKLINQRFDLNVSPNTNHKALQKAENGWKTEARIPDSWNEPKILELRKKFVQCLPSYGKGKTEFYLGECTFNLEENKKAKTVTFNYSNK
ncbi:hypothetical protein K502DRAFT_368807 [Neoconidiobolus thromboides FSU 785]|nr:hypothetical protein K502DRAFT_368807 [Neoconidiobolus thromboides FSU 785]